MIYCDKVSNSECSTWTFIITVVEVYHDDQGAFLLPISISYLPSSPLGSVGIPVLSNSSDSRSRNFEMIFQSLSLPIWDQKISGDVNIYHRSMLKKLHFSCRIASLTGKSIKKTHQKTTFSSDKKLESPHFGRKWMTNYWHQVNSWVVVEFCGV